MQWCLTEKQGRGGRRSPIAIDGFLGRFANSWLVRKRQVVERGEVQHTASSRCCAARVERLVHPAIRVCARLAHLVEPRAERLILGPILEGFFSPQSGRRKLVRAGRRKRHRLWRTFC